MFTIIKNASIRVKLAILIIAAFLPIVFIISLYVLPAIREKFYENKNIATKNIVEPIFNELEYFNDLVHKGKLLPQDAKKMAISLIASQRYDRENYFFIFDTTYTLLVHPLRPENIGKSMKDFPDAKGKRLYQELVQNVKNGEGFAEYYQIKPGVKKPQHKIAYLKYFSPWGWYLASGTYFDKVERDSAQFQTYLWSFLLLSLSIAFVFAFLISNIISVPITRLKSYAMRVTEGQYTGQLDLEREDEIGQFNKALQNMIESLKASIEKIQQQEERFRNMFDGHDAVMMLIDPEDGKIISTNPAASKFYGYSKQEFLELNIRDLNVLPVDNIKKNINLAIEETQNIFIFRHRLADGTLRNVEVFASPILFDNRQVLFSIVHDITERIQNEHKIRLQSAALDSAANAILITDVRGYIKFVNKAFCKLTGFSYNECIDRKPGDLLKSGRQSHEFYRALWTTILHGEIWEGDLINRNHDGKEYHEHMTITPIVDSKQNIDHFVAIKTDISDRIIAEKQLIAAKEKAEELAKVKSSILANMSHEIRTPMIAILGYSELLMEEIIDADAARMIEKIYSAGKRLLETLNLILDLSQIEAGKYETHIQEVDFCELIKEISSLYVKNAERKNLQLHVCLPNGVWKIQTDPRIINQILTNLLTNAIKYTDSGKVTVSFIPPDTNSSGLELVVEDTGMGIPEQFRETIFEEFRQVSEGRGRVFEGIGLGLALTKKFVEKLEGSIRVESEVNVGSRFTVSLPVIKGTFIEETESGVTYDVQQDIREPHLEGKPNLLIVEDESIVSQLLASYLSENFTYSLAKDAESAQKLLSVMDFDLILMDINLGKGMSGIDLTRILRAKEKYAKLPIIAMTAFAMVGDKEEFLEGGCTDYISKPFSRQELFTVIQKNMQGIEG
ncbi:MAG: PAS domain S-box protein [Ignavibacteria bacterium]|nr:PAS domain S-box protein [Ignavibacteria bacterium]